MKAVKKISVILVFLFVCMLTNVDVQAQCPMCKAAVESSVKGGQSNAGKGLNDGILYLLAAPYLLVGALGYIWYRNYRVKTKTDVKDEKIILN
jgi:hypothetical protein